MKCKDLVYRIICIPDTSGVEREVNELLKQFPEYEVEKEEFTTAPYYKRKRMDSFDGDKQVTDSTPTGVFFIQRLWLKKL